MSAPALTCVGLSTGAIFTTGPDRRWEVQGLDQWTATAPIAVRRVPGGWLVTCLGCQERRSGARLLSLALSGLGPHQGCIRAVMQLVQAKPGEHHWDTRKITRPVLVAINDLDPDTGRVAS